MEEDDESKALVNPGEGSRSYSATDSSVSFSTRATSTSRGAKSTRLRVYKRRWYILFLFVSMNITQNIYWNTFGPIQGPVQLLFHWQDWNILLLSLWAAIGMIILSPPMGWLMEAKGLRVAAIVTCCYLVVGKALQALPFTSYTGDTILVNIGQFIVFMAGPICVGVPTAVSAAWFPPNERTTATAIGAQSSYLGVAVGFLIGPNIVPDIHSSIPNTTDKLNLTGRFLITEAPLILPGWIKRVGNRFKDYMYIELALAVLVLVAIVVYFPSKPKLPPSRSSSKKRHDFQASFRHMLRNRAFWLIAVLFGVQFGVISGWLSIMDVILSKFDVDQATAGWVGFGCSIAGIVSGVLISRFADHIQRSTKCLLVVMLIGGTISLAVFSLTCEKIIPFSPQTSRIVLYVSNILGGFFIIGLIPLFFEIGVECTYPVNEGICSGFMIMIGNVCLLLFYIVFMFPNMDLRWINWVACGSVAVSIPGLLMYRERYTRLDVDTTLDDSTDE